MGDWSCLGSVRQWNTHKQFFFFPWKAVFQIIIQLVWQMRNVLPSSKPTRSMMKICSYVLVWAFRLQKTQSRTPKVRQFSFSSLWEMSQKLFKAVLCNKLSLIFFSPFLYEKLAYFWHQSKINCDGIWSCGGEINTPVVPITRSVFALQFFGLGQNTPWNFRKAFIPLPCQQHYQYTGS